MNSPLGNSNQAGNNILQTVTCSSTTFSTYLFGNPTKLLFPGQIIFCNEGTVGSIGFINGRAKRMLDFNYCILF